MVIYSFINTLSDNFTARFELINQEQGCIEFDVILINKDTASGISAQLLNSDPEFEYELIN